MVEVDAQYATLLMARVSSLDLTVNERSAETCGKIGKSPGAMVLIDADARSVFYLKHLSYQSSRDTFTFSIGEKAQEHIAWHCSYPFLGHFCRNSYLNSTLEVSSTEDYT